MQLWDKNEFLLLKKEHNFYREQAMNLVYCLKQNNTWKSRAVGATLLCAEWSLWRCWQTESWERLKIKSTRNAKDNDHVRWRDLTLSYFYQQFLLPRKIYAVKYAFQKNPCNCLKINWSHKWKIYETISTYDYM